MLDILEDLARKYQFPKIKLTVLKGNEQAIQLYKRRGYNLDTTDPSNFDLPTDHELYNVGYWIFSKNTFRNH
jgi:ribosomal protein S18 acetylase RimI-like enzyme